MVENMRGKGFAVRLVLLAFCALAALGVLGLSLAPGYAWAAEGDGATCSCDPEAGGTVNRTYQAPSGDVEVETWTYTASANQGYHFVNFTYSDDEGSKTADSPFVTTLKGDVIRNLVAHFAPDTFNIFVEAEHGTLEAPETAEFGETVTVVPKPDEGYELESIVCKWDAENGEKDITKDLEFTMPASSVEVTATFKSIPTYTVKTVATPKEGGVATPNSSTAKAGEKVKLTATPATGYKFVKWEVAGEGAKLDNAESAETEVTVGTADVTATATFEKETPKHSVNADVTPKGSGTAKAGESTAEEGASVALEATAAKGYTFEKWTVKGTGAELADASKASTTVKVGTGDVTATAHFKKETSPTTYKVTAKASPTAGGKATAGAKTAAKGDEVTLKATAADGYEFVKWTAKGAGAELADASKASTTVTVGTGDVTATATFKKKEDPTPTYSITAKASPEEGGTAEADAKSAEEGDEVAIEAKAAEGYSFVKWTVSGEGAKLAKATKAKTTVTVGTEDVTVTAVFEKDPVTYTISYKANGGTGTMSDQTAEEGTEVTLKANVFRRSGYTFNGWNTEKDGSGTSYDNKAKFELKSDLTLYAQWKSSSSSSRSTSSSSNRSTTAKAGDAVSGALPIALGLLAVSALGIATFAARRRRAR